MRQESPIQLVKSSEQKHIMTAASGRSMILRSRAGEIISTMASATTFGQSDGLQAIPAHMFEWEDVARERARRLMDIADSAGHAVVAATVEVEQDEAAPDEVRMERTRTGAVNLAELIGRAAEGDAEARLAVANNVRTDVVERSIKSGHITQVELEVGADGRLGQYGQSMEDVFINGLRYASAQRQMRRRSEAETRNGMRMEEYLRSGLLEDYDVVVVSRSADDMSLDAMRDCGFFTETMSCALQVVGYRDGVLVQESAFVSGVAVSGGERHDQKTIRDMLAGLGVDTPAGMGATDLLDMPVLVPRSQMPDGVVSLVDRYDEAAGGTFFGEYRRGLAYQRSRQEYLEYRQKCYEREADLEPLVEAVVEDLLQAAPELETPVAAIKRLAHLSGQALVNRAVSDRSIDVRIFGSESAQHILKARRMLELGDMDSFRLALDRARSTEKTSSCASGGSDGAESRDGAANAGDVSAAAAMARAERKGWKLKDGLCRVKSCPTRPNETKVGPCGVCISRCQAMFDAGKDPTKQ